MALHCRICGREGYDICPECSFKELNQQCWRCRMYLPKSEMQQYNGQWICPNCRNDMREEEKRHERKEGGPSGSPTGGSSKGSAEAEMGEKLGECERCGRPTDVFYIVGGKKLCKFCFGQGREYLARGPGGAAPRVQLMRKKAVKKSWLRKLIESIFGKTDEDEIEILEVEILSQKPPPAKHSKPPGKEGHDWKEHKKD